MATHQCPKCSAGASESERVCSACGFPLATRVDPADEDALLREAWEAMTVALRGAGLQGQPEQPVRDRFLENMPLPSTAAALLREALECQRFFREDVGAETTAPQTRFRACLNRLEVLAVDQPELTPRIAVLRRQLVEHRRQLRRGNVVIVLSILAALGALVGLGWLLLYGIGAILRAL